MDDTDSPAHDRPRVAVFAPAPVLVCTFEHPPDRSNPDVTLNVGGQGPWVARAAQALGADVALVTPLGGDTGVAAHHLLLEGAYEVHAVLTRAATACYVEEREGGERTCVRDAAPGRLVRQELDDLYSAALAEALDADVCVITGSPWGEVLDTSLLTRLTADLATLGRTTVADLSGLQLAAALDGGLDWLKVGHDELIPDIAAATGAPSGDLGVAGPDEGSLWAAAERLAGAGDRPRSVVVSRAGDAPSLVVTRDGRYLVHSPALTAAGARGSGDTMTAALATGLAAHRPPIDVLRWAAAAGAANVVRKGSATPDPELVERLSAAVVVDEVAG
ncbi:MAG TPA: PfkB family carbohydrate kinase [Acidimicrobiales bacterium]